MTANELLASLRSIDSELHSQRITAFYRTQSADTRRRFVGMRAYIAQALADATHAHLADLAIALEQNDAELRQGFVEVHAALSALTDALKILEVIGTVLVALSESVPGVLDHVLP